MSNQWGIDEIIPAWLFDEGQPAGFDDTATPVWAVAVEAAEGWEWGQSVCVVEGCEVEIG